MSSLVRCDMCASPFLFSSSRIVTGATRDELLVYLDKCGGIVRKEMQCSVGNDIPQTLELEQCSVDFEI